MSAVATKKDDLVVNGGNGCTVFRLSKGSVDVLRKLSERANKKDFGKRVSADQLVQLGLSLIRSEHLHALQQSSMSNADRLEALFRVHAEKKKSMTKDEFLGLLLEGRLQAEDQTAT